MKYFFLSILITLSYLGFSQRATNVKDTTANYPNLKLDKGEVFFEKVYQFDSLQGPAIKSLLLERIPNIQGLTDVNISENIITAKIVDSYIDYKKYGGKWGNTALYLNHPYSANVFFYWKDEKLRVLVSNIYFNVAGFSKILASDFLIKKNQFNKGQMAFAAGMYIDQYLNDLFTIEKSKNNW